MLQKKVKNSPFASACPSLANRKPQNQWGSHLKDTEERGEGMTSNNKRELKK